MNFLNVWKVLFLVFCKFLSDEVETFFLYGEANHLKLFKSKFGHRSFSENGFAAILSVKTNVLSVSKRHVSVFCKFFSDEVETVFLEGGAKRSKPFKLKSDYRKLHRKWFCIYLEHKNECFERLKRAFFRFLWIFGCRSWKHFLEK